MSMGTTGTVNITPEMMNNALKAIQEYTETAKGLKTQLESTMGGLVPGNFSGNAADGFKIFYDDKIVPVIGKGVDDIVQLLTDIVQGTLDAIPADSTGLDDQLASENKK